MSSEDTVSKDGTQMPYHTKAEEGRKAYRQGIERDQTPYPGGSAESREWLMGWLEEEAFRPKADNAEKDARIKELEHVVKSSGKIYSAKMRQIEALGADNAAQAARIKILEGGIISNGCQIAYATDGTGPWVRNVRAEALEDKLETYHEEYENRKEGYEKTIDSLEEKLTAAEQALEQAEQMAGDIIWSLPMPKNWDRDKAEYIDWCSKQSVFIRGRIREARAVLGGKL